jgi:L-ascorbate metabolism protein UlaG (beta-lactamase superfamily)
MRITLIGHSTVLIEASGKRILTDPFFSQFGNPAYARLKPPARSRQELSNVDLVLISHNHFDHIDREFLRQLPATTPVMAPARSAWMTRLKGGRNVIGMHPWEEKKVVADISIMAVPARHITFTVGYLIDVAGRRIYFAGDTYYSRFMERIGRDLHPQIALMPVTTYRIPMTMGEAGAVKATRAISPSTVIPIHLGISPRLWLMRTSQTPESFRDKLQRAGLPTNVVILQEGQSWESVA